MEGRPSGGTLRQLTFERALMIGGVVFAVTPDALLSTVTAEAWEAELFRWLGLATATLGWSLRSILRRALVPDATVRTWAVVGPVGGILGFLATEPLLLLVGFCLTVAAACRAGLMVGFDIHSAALRRLER